MKLRRLKKLRRGFTPTPNEDNRPHQDNNPRLMLGFTLVETLLYAVILSGFLLLAFLVTTQLFESARRVRIANNVSDETEFIAKKIEWAMSDASSTPTPAASSSGSALTIYKTDFADNPLTFTASGTDLLLSRASGTPVRLNSSRVKITQFTVGRNYDALNFQNVLQMTLTLQNVPAPDEPLYNTSTTIQTSFQY